MNNFSIVRLTRQHHRKNFSCGIEALDQYLQDRASQDMKKKISITYIMYDTQFEQVAGYYTLSAASIELAELSAAVSKKLPKYPYIPATLIGRLGVDLGYQGQGLGALLLADALKRVYLASHDIASTFVVVEAINDQARTFYERYGFLSYAKSPSKLYMPVVTLKHLFQI